MLSVLVADPSQVLDGRGSKHALGWLEEQVVLCQALHDDMKVVKVGSVTVVKNREIIRVHGGDVVQVGEKVWRRGRGNGHCVVAETLASRCCESGDGDGDGAMVVIVVMVMVGGE